MRLAYADPPYLGCGRKLYGSHHADAGLWDNRNTHLDLLYRLSTEFDGWAYSCNTRDLSWVLQAVPAARVAAWVKPFAAWKPRQRVAHAWEPVVFSPVRQLKPAGDGNRTPTVRDFFSAPMTRMRGLPGVKPQSYNRWVLDLLGYVEGDEVTDLFPGNGGLTAELSQLTLASV